MLRSRRESPHNDGITEPDNLQQTFATKSAKSGHAAMSDWCLTHNGHRLCDCMQRHRARVIWLKRRKLLVAPRRECAGKIRSDDAGGFDPQIGIVHPQEDVFDRIITPCVGDEVAVRNVPGRQKGHRPL